MKPRGAVFILPAALLLFVVLTALVITEHAQIQAFNALIHAPVAGVIHPNLTFAATLIGHLTHWYTYAPIVLLLLIIPRTRMNIGLPIGITLAASAITGPIILKNVFAIERPMVNQLIDIAGFGYPSGHSMNAVVFFGMCAIMMLRYAKSKPLKNGFVVFAVVAVLLVGLSRIYLGVHTLTDVIGGYLAGIVVLCAAVLIENRMRERARRSPWQSAKKSYARPIRNALIAILALVVLIHAIHAVTLDRIVVYSEISFSSPNIPPEMDGYRIAFVTDTHVESDRRLRAIVEELNKRQVDLLLLGGDFTFDSDDLEPTMGLLAQVATTDGIFGVEGNHDKYQALFAAMQAHQITPLSNSGAYVRENFYLAGVEDLWNRNPDVALATAGAGPDSFVLLLSHNPDVSMTQDTTNVDLILSGHTHGGQLNFFGRWSLGLESRVISDYGERFREGWAQSRDGVPVYVCRGIGEYYPRVFSRPQVTLITLVRE